MTAVKVIRARFDAECVLCYRWIRPGSQIVRYHGLWLCPRCALNRLDARQQARQ